MMIYDEIQAEVKRSKVHGLQFHSLHEAYAVILEEVDELWEITRQKRKDRSVDDIRKELTQIAAVAVKALESVENFVGVPV